jgi:hypothetical protein
MKGYVAWLLADGSEPIDPGYRRQPCEYEDRDDGAWRTVKVTSPVTFGPFEKHGHLITRAAIFDLPLGGREITPRLDIIPSVTTGPEPIVTGGG